MELSRRSRRSRVTKVPFTPSKLKSKDAKVDTVNLTVLPVNYELDRSKAIKNKIEAASRPHSVILSMARGNIVITFSAAAYEEFKSVTINYLHSKGLTLNTTETTEKRGAVVSESTAVFEGNNKLFVLNFYNSKSKILLNGNQGHIITFVENYLIHILDILDRNDSFSDINEQIREYCEQFLNKSGQSAENCQEIETASTGKKLSSLNVNKALSLPAVDNAACGNEPLIGPQFPLCLANLNSNTESVGQTPLTRTFELKENCQPTAMTESLLDQVNTLPSGPNMANSPDNTELHKAEIAHLQTQIEKRDKLLKVKDSKILKYESEIDQLKKQLSTNRAYSITLEDKNKDLQHSLLIINQRVEQLENYPTQGSTNSHSCTQNVQSTPQSEIGEMKIWFLEQKVRQLELDVHKNNTELIFD
ncbi:Hypothetical predicted protein [Mytilus galloprovincialis]|uniref:Uncharacterized protein n=1 Tax=Mytilus galloprovincialis TaxID=29158 RepID=A0A8B6BGU0_MYTGA|nr:Hypothetical predicted protein [Mytilus galloprovincialis]